MTTARFAPGQRARVHDWAPPGHVRTPWFVRGRTGVVEQVLGAFGNPETMAYAGTGKPEMVLYRVRFRQADLWTDYTGPAGDAVLADLYEHWLLPDEEHAA